MVVDMELQEAKEAVLRLMKDKDNIEAEIKELREFLDKSLNDPDEPLIDSEGYPRNDIDVYQIRHARHKIICLKNDHKDLMKKIEEGLHKVHSLSGNAAAAGSTSTATTSEIDTPEELSTLEPFLRVNLVSSGSPSELAGIQLEDLILEFGHINYRNFKNLKDIGILVEKSRYKDINVKIKRGRNVVTLTLTPRPWSGKGLLGCNVIPIEIVER